MPQDLLPMGQEQRFKFRLTPSITVGDAFEGLKPLDQLVGEGNSEILARELSAKVKMGSALVNHRKGLSDDRTRRLRIGPLSL
jgi:hypothetical protein